MNIFVLDEDPVLAASYHNDSHVVSQIKESAQMLSTVLGRGYAPTHKNHPCTLWVGESRSNALWLVQLCEALSVEHVYRYDHIEPRWHKSWLLIKQLQPYIKQLPEGGRTPFAQAMPEQFRVDTDAVAAYRGYYLGAKRHLAVWRKGKPYWWN